ncbi:neurofilament heavy polypeptide-like [Rhipicephalus sanguineus]|uniref:neurofilament heavy polypeptide-like n=1 Tax=Rhipicephalus sanguineus TaxID=34632 RepID=UPI0020C2C958|nr:neurofilament heavy polypeptide-like [Rhipicephalus sanguineus]
MSTEGKSSSKKGHDSQMEPQKKTVEKEEDSRLGTSKSRTTSSGVTSAEVHDPPKVEISRAKSPAKKSAPGPSRAKSPAKKERARTKPRQVACQKERARTKPRQVAEGASPSNIAARTGDWADVHKDMAPVPTDPDTGLPVHEPKYPIFENRGEKYEVLPRDVLEQEGIRTEAPLASVEDLTSPAS